MPTIVLASPKGGAGKSTSAVILATEFARTADEAADAAGRVDGEVVVPEYPEHAERRLQLAQHGRDLLFGAGCVFRSIVVLSDEIAGQQDDPAAGLLAQRWCRVEPRDEDEDERVP